MNVGDLYNWMLLEMNRDLIGGFLRPDDFNLVLKAANLNYFDKAYRKYQESQRITDDLRPLMSETFITSANGRFVLPSGYQHTDTISTATITPGENCGDEAAMSSTSITVVTNDEFTAMLSDYLTKPTIKHPLATIRSNYIEVEPSSINRVKLWYLKIPAVPFFDYNLDGFGNIVYLPEGGTHNGSVLPVTTLSRTVQFEYGGQALEAIKEDLLVQASKRTRDSFILQTSDNRIGQ